MSLKILVLGANGFIGNGLVDAILNQKPDWEVYGIDIQSDRLGKNLFHERFHFIEGDITIHKEWVEYHIKKCDIAIPLVAIATPGTYVKDPLHVFELDFEENLKIVRLCLRYNTRVIFPSTSEVYGMSEDSEFDEETSNFVLGPIHKERWIYSCCKQLMDRVIYAYGKHHGLEFTIFRPFNWMGPKLDNVDSTQEGSSRVITQFISNIIHGKDLVLVDGGFQKRSFTYLNDAIECLLYIIENKNSCASNRIFNIGNPYNNITIKELAEIMLDMVKSYSKYAAMAQQIRIIAEDGTAYYGEGYQDAPGRVPVIKNAETYLGWKPKTDLKTALKLTLDYYLGHSKVKHQLLATELMAEN